MRGMGKGGERKEERAGSGRGMEVVGRRKVDKRRQGGGIVGGEAWGGGRGVGKGVRRGGGRESGRVKGGGMYSG